MKKYSKLFNRSSNLIKSLLVVAFILAGNIRNNLFAQDWNQIIKVVASDRGDYDDFGFSVAISGDYAIVGAPYEEDATGGNIVFDAGSAYLFKNNAGTWKEVQKVVASDGRIGDGFGGSVAISGDYAIIGALGDHIDSIGNYIQGAGSVYIFKNNAGTWIEVQKIVASDGGVADGFGNSVAISGDNLIVGASREDHNATGGNYVDNAGSAYIFKNNAGTWSQVQKIVASSRGEYDHFGVSVAISGDYAIVGANNEDHDANEGNYSQGSGSAYIFKNNAGTWSQVQKIVASDRETNDYFGVSVAISGDYAIVGAYYEDHDATGDYTLSAAGAAYIFKENAGTWTEVQKIVASDRDEINFFGQTLAISGDYAIVGAWGHRQDTTGGNTQFYAGSAYIFKNNSGTWTEVQKIVASDRDKDDYFGFSVAISGYYAIVSAFGEDHDATGGNHLDEAGSAYIFKNNSRLVIDDNDFENRLKVHPNPSKGNFIIDLGFIFENVQLKITDITGKMIDSETKANAQVLNFSIEEPAGFYIVTIQADDKKAVLRLVKE